MLYRTGYPNFTTTTAIHDNAVSGQQAEDLAKQLLQPGSKLRDLETRGLNLNLNQPGFPDQLTKALEQALNQFKNDEGIHTDSLFDNDLMRFIDQFVGKAEDILREKPGLTTNLGQWMTLTSEGFGKGAMLSSAASRSADQPYFRNDRVYGAPPASFYSTVRSLAGQPGPTDNIRADELNETKAVSKSKKTDPNTVIFEALKNALEHVNNSMTEAKKLGGDTDPVIKAGVTKEYPVIVNGQLQKKEMHLSDFLASITDGGAEGFNWKLGSTPSGKVGDDGKTGDGYLSYEELEKIRSALRRQYIPAAFKETDGWNNDLKELMALRELVIKKISKYPDNEHQGDFDKSEGITERHIDLLKNYGLWTDDWSNRKSGLKFLLTEMNKTISGWDDTISATDGRNVLDIYEQKLKAVNDRREGLANDLRSSIDTQKKLNEARAFVNRQINKYKNDDHQGNFDKIWEKDSSVTKAELDKHIQVLKDQGLWTSDWDNSKPGLKNLSEMIGNKVKQISDKAQLTTTDMQDAISQYNNLSEAISKMIQKMYETSKSFLS